MAMVSVTLTPLERVRRAIIELQAEQPFFAHLSMALTLVPVKKDDPLAKEIATAGVNVLGELAFNEEWVAGIPRDKMKGLLAHETLHLAFDHLGRLGGRNVDISNVAMDMVVNMMVVRSNMALPDGTIPVDTGDDTASIQTPKGVITIAKVSERWWEDIYNELIKELDKKGLVKWVPDPKGKDQHGRDVHNHGAPMSVDGKEGKELSPAEKEDHAAKWRQRLAEAATIAKQQGKTPAGMERFIDGLLQPKVNWRELLRMYLKPYLYPTDFSYAKPHKKSQLLGVYLPDTVREAKEVEVLVDTSGSIGEDDLRAFMGEMVGIATSSAYVMMTVSFCDTQLYEDARYKVEGANIKKLLSMKPKGGGGTKMLNGLNYIKEHNRLVPVVIVLTDGCDDYDGKTRKSYPFEVIWCLSSTGVTIEQHQKNCEFGRVVKM